MTQDNKGTILVVDDEEDMLRVMKVNLRQAGYKVLTARTGEAGLTSARRMGPDLMIADIMLPGIDGMEMVRRLRQESLVPVIFLSARRAEFDRVLGLELGADDYLPKPFSVRELTARIEAVLRRVSPGRPSKGGSVPPIQVDPERREVRVHGRLREFTEKEFEILRMLVQANGRVLSRDQLLQTLWGADRSLDLVTRTVDQHVAHLRRKLGREGKRILTVPQRGYRVRLD